MSQDLTKSCARTRGGGSARQAYACIDAPPHALRLATGRVLLTGPARTHTGPPSCVPAGRLSPVSVPSWVHRCTGTRVHARRPCPPRARGLPRDTRGLLEGRQRARKAPALAAEQGHCTDAQFSIGGGWTARQQRQRQRQQRAPRAHRACSASSRAVVPRVVKPRSAGPRTARGSE